MAVLTSFARSAVLAAISSTGMPEEAKRAAHFLQDHVADLKADLIGGEFAIGADDFGHELGRIADPHRIGAKGAQAHGAEFRVAADDRVFGAPFQIVETGGVDEIHLGLEGRLKAVVPMLQRWS